MSVCISMHTPTHTHPHPQVVISMHTYKMLLCSRPKKTKHTQINTYIASSYEKILYKYTQIRTYIADIPRSHLPHELLVLSEIHVVALRKRSLEVLSAQIYTSLTLAT